MDNISKLRNSLPAEITGAFLAIKTICDSYWETTTHSALFVYIIFILLFANATYMRLRSLSTPIEIALSSVVFVFWAISVDKERWKDQFDFLFWHVPIPSNFTEIIIPIGTVLIGLAIAIMAGGPKRA